jgi:DNA uptake protein ComE-like DNA-binding protein
MEGDYEKPRVGTQGDAHEDSTIHSSRHHSWTQRLQHHVLWDHGKAGHTQARYHGERRLTEVAIPKMLQGYPPAKNLELQKYVSNLGIKIVKANNLEGNPYHYDFTVVDVVDVNALAMPAGNLFVTASLIAMDTKEQLEALPEIGPLKAPAIIAGGPYQKPEDLMNVKGVKEGTYNKIKDYVTAK